ncbi:hypothetical protein O181_039065 [Austropuccinia psidii MF-1]|uniref:Uncharacterized protein n=1 Tax=Austropuccinia psidii MF-1 TaxID=1389203 RepID=A0A9Q3DAW7_9BASI|nr:hypothetical protein [Austropuccinia psidii MF-1]
MQCFTFPTSFKKIPNSNNTHYPQKFPTSPSFIPPPSPSPSTSRPALVSAVRPSCIPQPRNSPMFTSQELKPVATPRRRREDHSPLPFPAAQVFQRS